MKMFIATHKQASFPNDPGYVPIHVGKAIAETTLPILCDNTGIHISDRNATFCECTALYWIWKNSDAETVGLCHYRRYFAPRERPVSLCQFAIASSADFDELGQTVDIIVPEPMGFLNGTMQVSVEQHYFGTAIGFDLHLAREAIRRLCPAYLQAFDFVMRNCQMIPFNMLAGKRSVVNDYLSWMFPILFQLEEWVPFETYGVYQKRALGFLAERLQTVWVVENRSKYRIGHRPVLFCES